MMEREFECEGKKGKKESNCKTRRLTSTSNKFLVFDKFWFSRRVTGCEVRSNL
jgi:hypothetical protein